MDTKTPSKNACVRKKKPQLVREWKKRLQEWITLAKQAGLGTEDIREMLEGLL